MSTIVTTIFADLDGSGVRPLYANRNVGDVVGDLSAGKLVACDSDIGRVYVSPASVRFVQSGRRSLPVSAGPSADSVQQHQRHITPALG